MLSPNHLLLTGLETLSGAHHQSAKQAESLQETATNPQLKQALRRGARQTLEQAKRLEKVFKTLDAEPDRQHDRGMEGILDAHSEQLARATDPAERDLVLIALAQTVAHVCLAQYGTLRAYARQLGNKRAAALLQKTLNEMGKADKQLTSLALDILAKSTGKRKKRSSSGLLQTALILSALALAVSGTKITAMFSLDADRTPKP